MNCCPPIDPPMVDGGKFCGKAGRFIFIPMFMAMFIFMAGGNRPPSGADMPGGGGGGGGGHGP